MKELHRGAVDKDGEAQGLNAVHDPANPPLPEIQLLEYPSKKKLAHPIIRLLHIQLDRYEAAATSSLKIMHEFLSQHNIVGDRPTTNKDT